jgi:hypothetical protein
MTGIETVNAPQATRVDGGETNTVVSPVANGLCLAAAPTFAAMAVLTYIGGGSADMMCSAAPGASLMNGMVPMYALMSAFHSGPWLKWIIRR